MALSSATPLVGREAVGLELSMTKIYAVQIGFKAVDRGMGFTYELGLYHARHALRYVNVVDGTNEILNRTISQGLLKGGHVL